jgi:hypothetical protein
MTTSFRRRDLPRHNPSPPVNRVAKSLRRDSNRSRQRADQFTQHRSPGSVPMRTQIVTACRQLTPYTRRVWRAQRATTVQTPGEMA